MKTTPLGEAIRDRKKAKADPILPDLYDPKSDLINDKLREDRVKRFAKRGIPVTNPSPLKGG